MIPIAKPIIGKDEEKAVLEVLRSGMLAQGKWVLAFEQKFAKFVGAKHAVATSNGTTALHLALLALGIGKGHEVITTAFSFIASSNSILFTGAKPVFVDIEGPTFNINPDLIKAAITSKTKAILAVDLFGLPANMPKIMSIAKKHNLKVIEDASQAHGAEIKNKKVGSIGDATTFSFYPTKNMTTGEGGMVTTNNLRLAEKIRMLREHGMKVRYHHEMIGYNYRQTNIGAAIGLAQLKKISHFNKTRINNAAYLSTHLSKIKGIVTPITPNGFKHVFHQFTIRITPHFPIDRDEVIQLLAKNEIGNSIFYPIPIHKQKPYLELGYKTKLPITETAAREVLSIPVHPSVSKKDLAQIVKLFNKIRAS